MKHTLFFIVVLAIIGSTTTAAQKTNEKIKHPETYNYNRGLEELGKNNYEEALNYLRKEIEENPQNGYAHTWIAAINSTLAEYGRALSSINTALKTLPKKDNEFLSSAYSVRAGVYLALKDTLNGMADYNAAIKIDPKEIKNYKDRAQLYYELGKYAEANEDYKHIIKMDEANVTGYMGIGRNCLAQEQWKEAIEQFTHVANLYSDYSSAYSFRAEAYAGLKKWNEATDDIITALKIDADNKAFYMMQTIDNEAQEMLVAKLKIQSAKNPNDNSWPYDIGIIYQRAQQYDKAIGWYEKSNQIDASSQALENIADCQLSIRNMSEALQAINKAIEMDENDASLLFTKADILFEKEDFTECHSLWNQIVENLPENAQAYYSRGCFLRNMNDVKGALEDFTMAVTTSPESPLAYIMRADAYSALGINEKAMADYQKVIELETASGEFDRSPYAFVALGKKAKGIAIMDSLIEKRKEDAGTYYNAACLYSRMKDKSKALEFLEKSMEKGFNSFTHIKKDYDMEFLKGTQEFKELLEKYSRKYCAYLKPEATYVGAFEVRGSDEAKLEISEIPFTKEDGVCKVKCKINDLPLYFVFDTGASSVSLSMVEATFMMKNGYLKTKDIVGSQYFVDANGNVNEGTVVNLRKVQFGELSIDNVRASVVKNQKAPLLLGQSVLSRIGKVEIDNQRGVVRIKYTK